MPSPAVEEYLKRFGGGAAPAAPDEPAFRAWYGERATRLGLDPNPDDPRHHYDYRAAFRAKAEPGPDGHWPSQFKADDHPNRFIDGVDTKTGQPDRARAYVEKYVGRSAAPVASVEAAAPAAPPAPTTDLDRVAYTPDRETTLTGAGSEADTTPVAATGAVGKVVDAATGALAGGLNAASKGGDYAVRGLVGGANAVVNAALGTGEDAGRLRRGDTFLPARGRMGKYDLRDVRGPERSHDPAGDFIGKEETAALRERTGKVGDVIETGTGLAATFGPMLAGRGKPSAPEPTVRLYRGTGREVPAWEKALFPDMKGKEGLWFTDDAKVAGEVYNRHPDGPQFVDVPKSVADKARRGKGPDGEAEFVLPPEWAYEAKRGVKAEPVAAAPAKPPASEPTTSKLARPQAGDPGYVGPERRMSPRAEAMDAVNRAEQFAGFEARREMGVGPFATLTPEEARYVEQKSYAARAKAMEAVPEDLRAIPNPVDPSGRPTTGGKARPGALAGQRGALFGGKATPAESSKVRDLVESASQFQLQNTRRASEAAHQGALTSLNAPADAAAIARGLEARVKKALGEMPVEQFHDALHELTVLKRGKGMSLVGVKGSALPDWQTFVDTIKDPRFHEAFRIDAQATNSLATPLYKASGGKSIKGGDPKIGGYTGHHSFLPYGDEDVAALAGKRILTPQGVLEGKGAQPPTTGSTGGLSKVANPKAKTAKQYKGTAPGYEGDYRTVRERQFADAFKAGGRKVYEKEMVASGNAWKDPKSIPAGVETERIDITPFNPTHAPRSIWVRKSLVPEARKIVGAEVAPKDLGAAAGDALTVYAISGNPAELAAHISGAQKAVQGAPTDFLHPAVEAIANLIPFGGVKLPLIGRFIPGGGSALGTVKFARALKVIKNPPPEELMSLASEVPGLLRRQYGSSKFLGSETAGKALGAGSHVIDRVWDGASVYLRRVYQNMIDHGGADPSPDAIRRFIQGNLGNYLTATQGTAMRTLKAYQNRFAVAGVTRFTKGVRAMLTGTGVTGKNLGGSLTQRALGASQIAGPLIAAYASWWMATGEGPPRDVPIGGAVGELDESGRPAKDEKGGTKYNDVADETFLRRGMRSTGADAYLKAKQAGLSEDQALGAMAKQAGQRLEGLTIGPTTSLIHGTATGEDPAGNRIAPFISADKNPRVSQYLANFVYTAKHGNPVGEGGFGMATGEDTGLSKLVERFTPGKAGPGEGYMDRLPAIRARQDIKAFQTYAMEQLNRAKPEDREKVKERLRKERESLRGRLAGAR